MSLPAISMKYFYFCLLASVYAIHQSMTYYKLMIIFRHHFIDLIYGNCFVCMLNNAWHTKVLNNEYCTDKWVSFLQTQCNNSFSFSIFINIYKNFYNHFSHTVHLFVVFYRVEGLYKTMRRRMLGWNHNI